MRRGIRFSVGDSTTRRTRRSTGATTTAATTVTVAAAAIGRSGAKSTPARAANRSASEAETGTAALGARTTTRPMRTVPTIGGTASGRPKSTRRSIRSTIGEAATAAAPRAITRTTAAPMIAGGGASTTNRPRKRSTSIVGIEIASPRAAKVERMTAVTMVPTA